MSLVLRDDSKKYFLNWQPTTSELQITEWTYTAYGGTTSVNPSKTKLVQTGTYSLYGSPYGSTPISGSWYDTTTQTTTANTATKMYCNTTDYENGITKKYDSNFEVAQPGKYNLQFSVQLDQSSGAGHHIFIWFRKNGVDIPYSASEVAIQGTVAESIPSWNYIFDLQAGDYVNVMYLVTDTGVQLKSVTPTSPVPGIPSVIITMWRL